jgi:hypothetical protein
MFSNASEFGINGGTFNDIQGNLNMTTNLNIIVFYGNSDPQAVEIEKAVATGLGHSNVGKVCMRYAKVMTEFRISTGTIPLCVLVKQSTKLTRMQRQPPLMKKCGTWRIAE